MNWLGETLFLLSAALALDRLVGDPPWLWQRVPHPIALAGRAIGWLEERLNRAELPFQDRRRRGIAALAVLAIAALATGWLIERVLRAAPLGLPLEILVVAVFLAHKSLLDHVAAVGRGLEVGGLIGGRRAVAEIVGRDVTVLDEPGVARAAIESAAENFSDGVVAPAFWFLLLGLPGLLAYKLVNTADSMIGHRSDRYEAYGWAAARLDDVLNYVPARLSAALIAAASLFAGGDAGAALRAAQADAPKHKSPNAGWPEAALAGALGLALGGPRRYGLLEVDGAWLNPGGRADAGLEDISATIRLVDAAWLLLAAGAGLLAIILLALAR